MILFLWILEKIELAWIGEVYNSSIYELTKNEGLDDLINYSGGLPVTAQTTKVNISRITPADKRSKDILANRELITFDYQKAKNSKNKTPIQDGDKITFFPILDLELNQSYHFRACL